MEIFPAIDLKKGRCVRLVQGDFKSAKVYAADPVEQAQKFAQAGAKWIHIVDLDGAESGKMKQADIIENIAKKTRLKIQTGGGIRDSATLQKLLDLGARRVVIGSLAVKNKALVQKWLREFGGNKIVLAFDIKYVDRQPEVLTNGWQNESRQILWDVLDAYEKSGLRRILCTDVTRDGMLSGPNLRLYREIHKRAPQLGVIASGGVGNLKDLTALSNACVEAAIVGKALYEGRVDLATSLQQARDAG